MSDEKKPGKRCLEPDLELTSDRVLMSCCDRTANGEGRVCLGTVSRQSADTKG